jgi:hypothetical protein
MNRQRWTAFLMTVAFGLSVVFMAGFITKQKTEQVMAEQGLPSISAIQRKLNELEPQNPLKIDGKLGRLTQEKWDKLYIRESAKAAFAEFEKRR